MRDTPGVTHTIGGYRQLLTAVANSYRNGGERLKAASLAALAGGNEGNRLTGQRLAN